MQMFENLPWYGYVILVVAVVSYAYRYFKTAKEEYDAPDLTGVKFRKDPQSRLTPDQEFAIAFYTPISEWWEAHANTLTFLNPKKIAPYLEGWGINTKEGYWDLTNYFIKDGRRWYFDFIHAMIHNEPEEQWNALMNEKFGYNDRAQRYLDHLKTNKAVNTLKQKGIITFDSEIDIGVVGYDAAMLVGQARKAYTAQIITEEEAWEVISFASSLARKHFSSWEDFGKSFILGFTLDISNHNYKEEVYHIYKQVLEKPESPWNTINW